MSRVDEACAVVQSAMVLHDGESVDQLLQATRKNGIPASEFSVSFARRMIARMATSFFKYGRVAEGFPHKVDAIASLRSRLDKYIATGNTEWLVDVANFAMIESMHPRHPNAHFEATDAAGNPGRVWHTGHVGEDANTHATESRRAPGAVYRRDGD
jgi:hypothetical protein